MVSEKAASGMIEMSFPCRDKILRLARPAQSDGLIRVVDKILWQSRTSKGVLLHTLQLVVRDDQGGQSGQVCEHVGRQHGHLVVAQVQPGEGLEVLQPVTVDGGDLVDVEVELGGLGGDALGDLLQLGVRAPHYRACAEIKIKNIYYLDYLDYLYYLYILTIVPVQLQLGGQ